MSEQKKLQTLPVVNQCLKTAISKVITKISSIKAIEQEHELELEVIVIIISMILWP